MITGFKKSRSLVFCGTELVRCADRLRRPSRQRWRHAGAKSEVIGAVYTHKWAASFRLFTRLKGAYRLVPGLTPYKVSRQHRSNNKLKTKTDKKTYSYFSIGLCCPTYIQTQFTCKRHQIYCSSIHTRQTQTQQHSIDTVTMSLLTVLPAAIVASIAIVLTETTSAIYLLIYVRTHYLKVIHYKGQW